MANDMQNWFLQEVGENVRVTDMTFPSGLLSLLTSLRIPIERSASGKRIIDWMKVPTSFQVRYDSVVNEKLITAGLARIATGSLSELFVDFGYQLPIVAVDAWYYSQNWKKFLEASNYMGNVVLVPDGSWFMELTDDSDSLLLSNIEVVTGQQAQL